eukprot:11330448-Alexandrium_andersonii.AAC.1
MGSAHKRERSDRATSGAASRRSVAQTRLRLWYVARVEAALRRAPVSLCGGGLPSATGRIPTGPQA